jgi:uncharacterized protein (DUF362 family)
VAGTQNTSAPSPEGEVDQERTDIILADTKPGIASAVREVFDHFGGGGKLLRSSHDVYIKVNAVGYDPYVYTDPEVLRQTILYFQKCGAHKIYIIENCSQGNFTRLVFDAIGYLKICKETGAIPVFLDETPSVPIFLEGIGQFVDISAFVFERLIEQEQENLYLSLPKLKTHSMSQVTLSIKNQFGLIHQRSRIPDHNFHLHQKFADIYRILRPNFVLIDGLIATNHGHYPTQAHLDRVIVQMDLLIGGLDPLATDVVAASLLGFNLDQVEHLRLSTETGIGIGDIQRINIINHPLFEARRKKLSCELFHDLPSDLTILRGKERLCDEGCHLNTIGVIEGLYRNNGGKGGFTILMGKGIDHQDVEKITGRVHIAGGCAVEEHGMALLARLGKDKVTMSSGCNDLTQTIHGLMKQMGVTSGKMAKVSSIRLLYLYWLARIKGNQANI